MLMRREQVRAYLALWWGVFAAAFLGLGALLAVIQTARWLT